MFDKPTVFSFIHIQIIFKHFFLNFLTCILLFFRFFEYLKVNNQSNFFRQFFIFMTTHQNVRSFLCLSNSPKTYVFMWIMWITLCKTLLFPRFSLPLVWISWKLYLHWFRLFFTNKNIFVHFAYFYAFYVENGDNAPLILKYNSPFLF